MINVSDTFKEAMKKPVKTITASLVLDDNTVITGQDKLIKITIDSSGHLFGTSTSVVNVELFGTDYNLVDHTFSVIAKTLVDIENDTWEEANLGLFYVEESTADFEKKVTKIKGYDLMGKLAKTPYNSGTIQFPCTVKELINQLAECFEFTVDTNLDNLPNITYQIPEDLYAKISNCTYRDILGEIAGATATVAVFNGKTLSFRDSKKKTDEDEIWTYDNLRTLKYKPKYGPVNSLVLARTPQEDNIAVSDNDSITANGLTEVKLANNEILDDDRRNLIDPIFNSIKGLSYHPFESETTGFGWYKPGDLVSAQASGGLMNGTTKGYLGQKITTGKNLLNFNNKTENYDVNFTINNGYIRAFGTTATNWITLPFYQFNLAPGTYTISRDGGKGPTLSIDSSFGGYHNIAKLSPNESSTTFSVSTYERNCYIVYNIAKGTKVDITARFMVEVGNTATSYEPYTGRFLNLFDEFTGLPLSRDGITLSNQNGALKLKGKPTADWIPLTSRNITDFLQDKQTYTVFQPNIYGVKLYPEVIAYRKDGGGAMSWNGQYNRTLVFTVDFDTYSTYRMKLQMGPKSAYPESITFYNNLALFIGNYIQKTPPEYSPYNTGLASPRPQYPQVVKELSGGKISITGKNLLKISSLPTISNGLSSTVADDGTVSYSGRITSTWADISKFIEFSSPLPVGTYTLSIDHPRTHKIIFKYKMADGVFSETVANSTSTSVTKTFIITQPIIAGYLYIAAANGSEINDTVKVQLEVGDTATPFVPYESSEFTLPSGLNVYKLTDNIYDEVKLENGVTKLIKRVAKLELTGEENNFDLYQTTRSGTLGFRYYDSSRPFTQQQMISDIVCSHFVSIDENKTYQSIHNKTGVSIYNSFDTWPSYADKLCFWFSAPDAFNLKITDVTSFKNWLKAEKAKGTPVTVYYELKEPQITELGRTNLNQVYITDTHLELGNGIKETIKGVAPTATQTDYARAGGITKTIYNTEIKVDKQKQEIESVVSKQTQVDQKLNEEFTKVTQNIKDVVTTIQTTGGGNLIKNSVGYAKNQDGTLVEWSKNNVGEVKSYTSPESRSYGAISGNAIELKKGASITQRLNVASSGKIPYSLSFRAKKGSIGTATVKLSNTIDSFVITIPENKEIIWQSYDLTNLDPSMNYLDITVSTSNNCEQFLITDLMVNMGDQVVPWVQANGEILNTQVAVNDQGMMVSSSIYSGDYVQITPLGMSGHSNVTGTDEEVFKLNRDVTETSKLSARKEISMDPIKIIPVKDGDMAGWNFVG